MDARASVGYVLGAALFGCTTLTGLDRLTIAGDASLPVSAPAQGSGITCAGEEGGTHPCSGAAPICCIEGDPPTFDCLGDPSGCDGTVLRCAKAADCPNGDFCCATEDNGTYTESHCAMDCDLSQGNNRQLCDPDAGDCPSQTSCEPSGALLGYFHCK